MESERVEVFERIPWETLDSTQSDRKWIVYALAGAITVGALAYSFARSQPAESPIAQQPSAATSVAAPAVPASVAPQPTVASPMVVAEADLYAVDAVAFKTMASTHAEWAAVEYFTADQGDGLMPSDTPVAVVPDGVTVFVDWVGATRVIEIDQLNYTVEVAVRSLVSDPDGVFVRQPTQVALFEVAIGDDGLPHITAPPRVGLADETNVIEMGLLEPPADVRSAAEITVGPVVGGRQLPDGTWSLVAMSVGPDGIQRAVTVNP